MRRSIDLRDMSPHGGPGHAVLDAYRARGGASERWRRGSLDYGEIQRSVIVDPHGEGAYLVRDQQSGATKVVRADDRDARFSAGQVVTLAADRDGQVIISGPTGGQAGVSESQRRNAAGTRVSFGLLSATPFEIAQGASESVMFAGFGLSSGDSLSAVVVSDDGTTTADPLVTVSSFSVTSATEASATVEISSDAPVGYTVTYELTR